MLKIREQNSINKKGKITRINNGKYTVNVNGMNLTLTKNNLKYVKETEKKTKEE